ncbi:hypothetical protein SAMN05421858_0840 [Haladaptatus litoreus]|uniref:Uncharacterized protein n=1 Tax=Haladaptatus litoreus TaxID=553468 RepID=A0A1N6WRP0_9EURY|nr:hypothetical protein [Haladaptatus litoreus]SIQ92691.1 hypothetical protein SAMN05421858_0840 [Haladaptatus litoreus]
MMQNNDSERFDRRGFIKGIGTAAGAISLPLVGQTRGQRPSTALLTAAPDDSISTAQMQAVRRRVHEARGVPFRAETVPAEDTGEIVAFAYGIDSDGVPWQYVGIGDDGKNVAPLKAKAERRANQFARGDFPQKQRATASDVTTQASWDRIVHDEKDYCVDPYGCVTDNFDVYQLASDGDAYQDAYSVKHVFAMEPGVRKYSSDWENDVGRPLHDWSAGDIGGEDLDEWDPLGTHDGSQTINVSIGTSGASLGWSYTQPAVTTIDRTSPSGNYAEWSEEFNTSTARRNTNGMKPGSRAWVNQHSSGKYHLLDVVSDGQFQNAWGSTHSVKFTWHVYVYA